jgi:hypothetical protein
LKNFIHFNSWTYYCQIQVGFAKNREGGNACKKRQSM